MNLSGRFKGAVKIEWLAMIAALAVLFLLFLRNGQQSVSEGEGTELETRLAAVLQTVEGVGRVKVLVNERQAVPAFSGGGANEREVTGVVIVAEGARDLRIALAIQQATKTLLNVELDQIQVLEMHEGG